MSKTLEQVEQFITLRASGYSFEKISQKIGVSKPILLKWERDNREQIEHERSFEVQAILSKHNLMRLSRIEAFSSFLEAVLSELKKREESLSSLSTEKLLTLGLSLEQRLSGETQIEILSSIESAFEGERTQRVSVD